MNTVSRSSSPFLPRSLLQFFQSLRRLLTTAHASIPVIHNCSIGFKFSDLNGQGSTVAFWLARKSTIARAVCGPALSCWKTALWRFSSGRKCDVKTSSLYRVFQGRLWHPTSSNFLRRNCRPQGRSSLRTSHSGVCRHVCGHLFSAAWILIHRRTRLASSFAPSDPCKSTSQYCAKVRTSGA